MPELPEVETTLRGISPHVLGQRIAEVIVRRFDLRQPIPSDLGEIEGLEITSVSRRSKYLLVQLSDGSHLLIHLGMSGSLRLTDTAEAWKKHDHVALTLGAGKQLRFHDPRRFGIFLYLKEKDPTQHPLLALLGPEPFDEAFSAKYLMQAIQQRSAAIKNVIMDAKVVVGVGNIYASEALFRAGISPRRKANRLRLLDAERLASSIQEVLREAIDQGGTTLRDFLNSDGQPGYFKQRLFVYDRKGQPCRTCDETIRHCVIGQRSSYWCPRCQK